MRTAQITFLVALLGVGPAAVLGQPTTLTQAGHTGLGITPNAHLVGWGRLETTYDRQLPGVVRDPSGHNFVAGFGLLPNLEIAGRLATNTISRNCFFEDCGAIRDLSLSGKLAIGLDSAGRFRVALGATDVGGATTDFRSYYGVLTYDEGPFEASAGVARRSGARPGFSMSPLHGPFAGAAWTPRPWVRAHVEFSDGNAWAGVRLFAPGEWLPEGWTAFVGSNHRLNRNDLTRGAWITAGLSIPLYKVPELPGRRAKAPLPPLSGLQRPLPVYEARNLPSPTTQPPASQVAPDTAPQPAPGPAAVLDRHLQQLSLDLKARGLEDIWLGRMPDGSIAVRANNATYNWNSSDALGAALGAVARTLGFAKAGYRLLLTQRQIPLVAVTGQTDCLRQWIEEQAPACAGGELSTPGTGALENFHEGVAWVVQNQQPSRNTLRVALSPVLRTNVGTEVGALDYSAGINVALQLPLWDGASLEWHRNVPVDNTSDYEPPGPFGYRRIRSETEQLAFVQTVRVPLERWTARGDDLRSLRWGLAGVTAQAAVGRFGSIFDGIHGALRWEPGDGRHRLTGQVGYFRNSRLETNAINIGVRHARPLLAGYRYSVTPTRTYLEATGGQFMSNDRGFQLGLRQWFGDVSVNAYYRRTRFSGEPTRQFVGLQLSLPLGPRRDMVPGRHVQVTGTQRFTHGIETLVRDVNNAVRTGFGVVPPTPSLDATFNSDRAGLVYFEDNVRRIRDAAR